MGMAIAGVRLRKFLTESGYVLLSMNKTKEKTLQPSDVAIAVELDLKDRTDHQLVLEKINNLEYVNYSTFPAYISK